MAAWKDTFQIPAADAKFVTFMADADCSFSKALDLVMSHDGPKAALGGFRSKRFAVTFDNGVATNVFVAESPTDPSGDGDPTVSFAPHVLKHL
ncbi:hypothetical protein M885DRAFT_512074 [Pelagophyceae sp. CCMP2097]|nr:hypothetical protein M885DRAFT_512074 [Pelagophyceae sp. CCMP2097]|mmetsp:Transcript_3469/g.10523  ORF Transcript_3469/g.10523 Transcript_3469/m.10523 type:complete len:93 (+) Transcript_3469:338-616(+)